MATKKFVSMFSLVGKKAPVKKAAGKKAAAKPAVKKVAAKKPAAKKVAVRKPAVKGPAAKKSAAKKPVAKKAVPRTPVITPLIRPYVPAKKLTDGELRRKTLLKKLAAKAAAGKKQAAADVKQKWPAGIRAVRLAPIVSDAERQPLKSGDVVILKLKHSENLVNARVAIMGAQKLIHFKPSPALLYRPDYTYKPTDIDYVIVERNKSMLVV